MIAIGNGESRSAIDIDKIQDVKVGCNAVIRSHFVEHTVCVDKRMLKECVQYGVNTENIHTRPRLCIGEIGIVKQLPDLPYQGTERWDDPFHWGSGPYAVLIAASLSATVKMIGFDLYSNNDFVNNCYKDTENYDPSTKRAVDPKYWIHQIGKVFEYFPHTEFTIFQAPNWQLPKKWNLPNVYVDKISNFTYT